MKIFGSLKKEVKEKKSYIEVPSLVVGEDIHTLCYIFKRKAQFENSKFIISKKLNTADIFGKGYEKIRGKQNIKFCMESPIKDSLSEEYSSANFFKDNQFRPFGGRSKNETLQKEEVFFTQKSKKFLFEKELSFLKDSSFWVFLDEKSYTGQIKSLRFKEVDSSWAVELLNGTVFSSKNLVWGLPPWKLLSLIKDKSSLNNEFIEFCESTKGAFGLKVLFKLKSKISDMGETFFIPLSLTHEWGHFLGSFFEMNGEHFLELEHYFDPEELSEEEVSRRIKILKRSLEKIFPSFSKDLENEYLSIDENATQVVDNPLLKDKSKIEGLTFVGENAPLPNLDKSKETQDLSHFVRGLISSGLVTEPSTEVFKFTCLIF